jgi:hypothetical protein
MDLNRALLEILPSQKLGVTFSAQFVDSFGGACHTIGSPSYSDDDRGVGGVAFPFGGLDFNASSV